MGDGGQNRSEMLTTTTKAQPLLKHVNSKNHAKHMLRKYQPSDKDGESSDNCSTCSDNSCSKTDAIENNSQMKIDNETCGMENAVNERKLTAKKTRLKRKNVSARICISLSPKQSPISKSDKGNSSQKVSETIKKAVKFVNDNENTTIINGSTMHKCSKCDMTFHSMHGLRKHSFCHTPAQPTTSTRRSSRIRSSVPLHDVSTTSNGASSASCDLSSTLHDLPSTSCEPSMSNDLPSVSHDLPSTSHDLPSTSHGQPSTSHDLPSSSHHSFPLPLSNSSPTESKDSSPPCEKPEVIEWIKFKKKDGKLIFRCALCAFSDRTFSAVSSVRKHIGSVHPNFTGNLAEPAGLYDVEENNSATCNNNTNTTSTISTSSSSTTSNVSCTCSSQSKTFPYQDNKLTHLQSNCPVHKETNEPKKIMKGTQILKCKHCDEEYDSINREKFQEHELSHELEATEPTFMTYACFECEVEFTMANELMEHYEKEH